jgi:tRNA(Arg) A34 adenosine deaminase TadA
MCLAAIYWARLDRIFFANTREDAASIGFDDAHIYVEVSKPIEERVIPTVQLTLPEAENRLCRMAGQTRQDPLLRPA